MTTLDRALLRIVRFALPRADREWMAGDLEEEHARRTAEDGPGAATHWLAGEAARNITERLVHAPRAQGGKVLRHLHQDLRYATRMLLRTRAVTATIVVTLALGIGANTAIFSVVDGLLFKPLPYPHAERLVAVTLANDSPLGFQSWPYPKYAAFAREQRVFDVTAAYARARPTVMVGAEPLRVAAEVVSSSYFALTGAQPALGRVFTADEEQVPARDAVVILGDALWRSAFGADPGVIGRGVAIKGRSYTIVGVMPPGFRGQDGTTEMWLPVMMADHFYYKGAASESSAWWMRVAARLGPDVSIDVARARMPGLTARVFAIAPSMMRTATRDGRELFQLVPFRDIKIDPDVSRAFVVLLAAVAFVLLVACANSASLLLGRALARRTEFAVRTAIGASRGAIVRQVLVESLLLAAVSGAAAMVVSWWTLQWLGSVKPMNTTGFWSQYAKTFDYFQVSLDARVAAFNGAAALAVGLLFGVLPALQASRADQHTPLKQRGGSAAGFLGSRARSMLVIVEIAFSMVLLVGAGLMARSFARAASVDLGFAPDRLVAMTATLDTGRPVSFYRDLLERVRSMPGVDAAALGESLPLSGGASASTIEIEGRPPKEGIHTQFNVVTPAFFSTVSIARHSGRVLADADNETAPRVAVVTRAFAQAAWPGQDAVGKRVRHPFRMANGDPNGWTTIVGVVGDAVYGTLEEPVPPMIYLSAWQPLGTPAAVAMAPSTIVLRTSLPSGAVAARVRSILNGLGAVAPLNEIATMEERAGRVTARYRYSSAMMGALAALALLLAAIGTYGVMAYSVTARTREIGIRVALGASPSGVVRMLLRGGLTLTLAGLAFGLAGAYGAARLLSSMLFDVTPRDPATFAAVATLMMLVGALATYLPAQRALRVDPASVLRRE